VICGVKVFYMLRCEAFHFLLSSCVGWLAYWLTSTTLSHSTIFQNGVGVFSIHRFSLLVAVCCAVCSHILEDYTLNKF